MGETAGGPTPARAMESGTAPLKTASKSGEQPSGDQTMAIVKFIKGNFTPWWFLGTCFVIYFLCSLGLPRIVTDGAVMGTHIPVAFMFVIACSWNLFHTPSHGPTYRRLHKVMGWTALTVGFISVLTGYIYILNGESQADLGTKILMMAIGLMQLMFQILGLWYVRGYTWIHMHSSMMTYMFYMSGVLIAINWLPKMATGNALGGTAATNWMFVSMLSALYIARIAVKHNRKAMEAEK